ncbi:MAG: hypothetical protein K2Q07_03945 [Burkholderiaceae bacterium]|nr:hypothetical protein [Burkholderiaceae bacterium]
MQQQIAAPMVGGMLTASLLSTFVASAVYLLLRRANLGQTPLGKMTTITVAIKPGATKGEGGSWIGQT